MPADCSARLSDDLKIAAAIGWRLSRNAERGEHLFHRAQVANLGKAAPSPRNRDSGLCVPTGSVMSDFFWGSLWGKNSVSRSSDALAPLFGDFDEISVFNGHAEFGGPFHRGVFDKRGNGIQVVGISWQAQAALLQMECSTASCWVEHYCFLTVRQSRQAILGRRSSGI